MRRLSKKIKSGSVNKGFSDFKAMTPQASSLIPKIRAAFKDSEGISEKDRRILEIIIASYEKNKIGERPDKEDFVLSGHEIAEFNSLNASDICRYLCYRYAYNKYPQLYITDDYPPCLQIEPSSVCNFRCKMCFQSDESFSKKDSGHMGYMELGLYKDIIDQVEGKLEAVSLASRGEPLLNKDIIKMIKYSADKFLGFKINTNASLLGERMSRELLENMNTGTIVFSLETTDADMYEKTRIRGKFDRIVKNIAMFKDIKEKYHCGSKVITRVSGVNIDSVSSMEDMRSFWFQYVDQVGFTNCMPWVNFYENETNALTAPCSDLWRRMFIWYDGTVNPCDNDYKTTLSVGNVRDSSVSAVWRSKRYEELRRRHLALQRGALSPCRQCTFV
ncbi:MAG: SPASM domain-containing protein [Candidatus Omnitrophica bacterium]|nr:SPASM domain-containing protein [Candidatus Omnitrophota bacterium]